MIPFAHSKVLHWKSIVQAFLVMGYNPREHVVNYLIVNACVKTTEMFICE